MSSFISTALDEAALPDVLWLPAVLTPGRLISAVPSKDTPPIFRAFNSFVAVSALPVKLPVTLPVTSPLTAPVIAPLTVVAVIVVAKTSFHLSDDEPRSYVLVEAGSTSASILAVIVNVSVALSPRLMLPLTSKLPLSVEVPATVIVPPTCRFSTIPAPPSTCKDPDVVDVDVVVSVISTTPPSVDLPLLTVNAVSYTHLTLPTIYSV